MTERVLVYHSELRAIAAEANRHPNRETGGDLYGLWTHGQRPVIFLATGPGPQALGKESDFQQDHNYIMECEQILYELFGIQYIGDWHSHHWFDLRRPSGGDIRRARGLLSRSKRKTMVEILVNHLDGGYDVRYKSMQHNSGEDMRAWRSGSQRPKAEHLSSYFYSERFGLDNPIQSEIIPLEGESPIRMSIEARKCLKSLRLNQEWADFSLDCIIFESKGNSPEGEPIKSGFLEKTREGARSLVSFIRGAKREEYEEYNIVDAMGSFYSDEVVCSQDGDHDLVFVPVLDLGIVLFIIQSGKVGTAGKREILIREVFLGDAVGSTMREVTDEIGLSQYASEPRPMESIVKYLLSSARV